MSSRFDYFIDSLSALQRTGESVSEVPLRNFRRGPSSGDVYGTSTTGAFKAFRERGMSGNLIGPQNSNWFAKIMTSFNLFYIVDPTRALDPKPTAAREMRGPIAGPGWHLPVG